MRHRLSVLFAVATAAVLLVAAAASGEDKVPDATVRLSEGSVAAGIGWNWASGELMYQGKTYHFKVEGLSVAELGITKAEATGNVYNLRSLDDFAGVFAAASAEGTVGKGAGVSSLRNSKGVVINLKSETKGANLKIAASGLKFVLER
jgi:hypothetical protein